MGTVRLRIALFVALSVLLHGAGANHDNKPWNTPRIIPSCMVGVHLDEEVHVARVRVGSKRYELRLVLDFSGRDITISNVPQMPSGGTIIASDPSAWSSTYSAAGGGSDILWLEGHGHRLPVVYDPTAAAAHGCSACNGVLGVGAGSPLWLLFPDATFSAGSIVLGGKRNPVKGSSRPLIACDPLSPHLCVSRAQVYGTWYDVEFSFQSPYTFVPLAVYNAYVGTKSVSTTPFEDWDSLVLRFRSADAPADPRQPQLRIAPSSLIGSSRRSEVSTLMLRPNPNPADTRIILGDSAFRSIMIHVNFATGTAAIQSYDSVKRYPMWIQIMAVVVSLVFLRWWTTRDALFYESRGMVGRGTPDTLSKSHSRTYPGEWGVYPDRMLIELAAIPGAIALLYVPPFSSALTYELGFNIYLQLITYASVAWILALWTFRLLGAADMFGTFTVRIHPSAASSPSKEPAISSTSAFTGAPLLGPGPPPPPVVIEGSSTPQLAFVVYRAALIRQASVDILLFVVLIMFSVYTRSDTLGQTMVAIACSFLSGIVLYNLTTSVIHVFRFRYHNPVGQNMLWDDLWVLWIAYCVIMAFGTAAMVTIFVLIPFFQLHVTGVHTGAYLMGIAVVYVVGLGFAYLAADRVADDMELWIRNRKETMQYQLDTAISNQR